MNFVKPRVWLCLAICFQPALLAQSQSVIADSAASGTPSDKLAISPASPRLLKNSPLKTVAPGQAGVVGVSVMGEADFDVSEIEPSSLRLHGAQALSVSTRDVDGSGKTGLYATFDMKNLKMHPNAATVRLTAQEQPVLHWRGSDHGCAQHVAGGRQLSLAR